MVELVERLEDVFYKNIDRLFMGRRLCEQLKKLMLQNIEVDDFLYVHDDWHASAMVSPFVDMYLTVRIHFWCKQLREKYHLESRMVRASGQAKWTGVAYGSHAKKLRRLNVSLL